MHKDRSQCSSPFSEKKNLPGQQKLRSIAVFSFFRNSLFLQPDIGWIWAFFIPYLHNTTTLMKMEGGNPSVLSKFSSSKRNGANTMHNFQSLFCAETGAGCGLVRHLAADEPGHFDTHLLVLVICRGEAPPSCCARPFWGFHCSASLRKREQRSFCSAQNPASFGVKLAYGVVFAGNPSKEKA